MRKMFDLLKEKISSFVSGITKKLSEKEKKEEEKKEERREEKETKKEEKKEKKKEEKKEETQEERREIEAKPTFVTQIKGMIFSEVEIKEEDIRDSLEELETQLLTADVALPVAEEIKKEIGQKVIGRKLKVAEIGPFINKTVKETLSEVLEQKSFDIVDYVRKTEKPVKILFVGPNGQGKTTTIAKIANLLKENGISCVLSASDTFRAAAVEQTAEHAKRLDIPVIKHNYGADPAAVAFDAVKYAEAKKIDVVLIDTAGRQETSRNLVEEMKKIARVIKPHLKIFVGEAIAGNAIIEQISQFNSAIQLDGAIITKLDCDAKGGTAISIKRATEIPILYISTGQGYKDIVRFDREYILSRIFT